MQNELKTRLLATAQIEQVNGCENLHAQIEALNFQAIHEVECFGDSGYNTKDGVATIKVRGLLVPETAYDMTSYGITGYDVIEKYLKKAQADTSVSSIRLDIDSGGGFTKGLQALVNAIEASEKPVKTHASGSMLSAAYWLGCSANGEVSASESSSIGSIGVYLEHMDQSKRLADEGIITRIFRSGKWKGFASSDRPLTEEAQERLQEIVMEQANSFFAHVSDNRGISIEDVAALEGDSFNSERALELNLIDKIGGPTVAEDNSGAQASETVEPKASTEGSMEGVKAFTQADIDAAVAKAAAQAAEKANELVARHEALSDVKGANAELVKLFKTEAFASVETAALVSALSASPASNFTEAMEADGGAGVAASPTEIHNDKYADFEARQAAALEKQKDIGSVL